MVNNNLEVSDDWCTFKLEFITAVPKINANIIIEVTNAGGQL